ncbi:N-acetylglucosamine kinase [Cohnella sp. JJ-181]|uniref:N-acetylglucosamine kinase n=1 Tax=Cohnella rhizoplanae TaxID=2974897 RepID=UPI0022FF54AA|nr:BadF/BadG/BcrA/BcrD ATPase family protein [Cohnella sp. JJ-181]CAI6076254.1 N-acetylmuramic acid/N-acetylglucosamine kinase [Cohnella sp. JJ-181]
MKYAAGLDGGGTKTAVTVLDENGRTALSFESGGINYNGRDEADIQRSLAEIADAIAAACGGPDACAQMVVGAAGVSNPAVPGRLVSALRDAGYRGGVHVVGDHETALFGALGREHGMILIAGTGSICFGRSESGQVHRTGGFGYLIDDEGSGYSIGRDLLAAVVRSHDGRAPATALTEMVYDRLGIGTVGEIVSFVYDRSTGKQDIAALAPLLSVACALGDEAALRIAERTAAELVELVLPVAERLSLGDGELAMAGSVLLRSEQVREAFVARLRAACPGVRAITPRRDASAGAALMALRMLQ